MDCCLVFVRKSPAQRLKNGGTRKRSPLSCPFSAIPSCLLTSPRSPNCPFLSVTFPTERQRLLRDGQSPTDVLLGWLLCRRLSTVTPVHPRFAVYQRDYQLRPSSRRFLVVLRRLWWFLDSFGHRSLFAVGFGHIRRRFRSFNRWSVHPSVGLSSVSLSIHQLVCHSTHLSVLRRSVHPPV